jgi:molybdopterin synthase sulfur carrier subunit
MQLTLRYFASIREAVGTGSEVWQTTAKDLAGLRDELILRSAAHAGALARGRAVRVAMNQVLCPESDALADDAEVAFFPPVTGG